MRIFTKRTFAAAFATLLACVAIQHPLLAASTNLIDGGGFERGLGDWQNYGTAASITQTDVHSGRAAVEINPTGGVIYTATGLTPGTSYTFSGYVKLANRGEQARLTVQGYGGKTVSTGCYEADYTLKSITFTAVKPSADVVFWKDGGSGAAFGDDFALVSGSTPLEIAASPHPDFKPADASAGSGLLSNGGFEAGTLGGWQNYGTAVSVSSDDAHSGKFAAKIDGKGGCIYEVDGLKPNTSYEFSAWAKIAQPGEFMRLTVSGYGGPEKSVQMRSSDYEQSTLDFTTGPTTTSARVIFWKDGGTSAAYVDDLSLTQK